ncbi:OmpA family protein [Heliobacterium chlorum]|uniref:OmpA family protein n=1 Tax=Heliobacterium chlorum TaxID=2698 RepID=A0ABR7T3P7_HELCL|nr:flagellar motor protein MotB [Heliobacterium chlorum]MBC9785388.1 OmpA family protein [Heliobacterium chlorum]
MSKKKQHHEEHVDETWLIPYADMLTLLLALFIVMFAVSQVDTKKFEALKKAMETVFKGGSGLMMNSSPMPTEGASDQPPEMAVMESLREARNFQEMKTQMDKYIQDKGLQNQIETSLAQEGLQISFRDAALFDSGKANLRPEALPTLDVLAELLSGLKGNDVRIAGHTDNLPISTAEFPSNWDLSAKRALNVMKRILNQGKLDPAKFTAVGYGEYHPKDTNDTAEGRANNRRVEVLIIRKYPDKTSSGGASSSTATVPAVVKPSNEENKIPSFEGLPGPGEPKRLPSDTIPEGLKFVN